MVQILITVMLSALILPLAYFRFQTTPLPKRMLIAGSIVAAALASAFLQYLELAFYVPVLAIVAISMIGAIAYAKIEEKEKEEKQRIADERKQKRYQAVEIDVTSIEETAPKAEPVKSLYDEPAQEKKQFAMQTIGTDGEER
ncbi:hypothetical protein [Planococcus sp. CAU13]|uniref:hypothetical protein n=1 Tax=Planococcus sp. CAU13 TaxID=1541197 RepID=UPI00052FE174|nr:hypothetical protein [Planococcus sp. CAU13]